MTLLPVFTACFLASLAGGVCGIGGGVLMKPVLDAMKVMSVSAVSFLSGITVLVMSAFNLLRSRKEKTLELRGTLLLGLGAAVGGVLGKQMFSRLLSTFGQEGQVGAVQAAVLGVLVLLTLLYERKKENIRRRNVKSPVSGGLIGLFLGVFSSFLGIGGGPVNLVALSFFYSMDTKKAAVHSIFVILLSQTAGLLFSVLSGAVPDFDIRFLWVMTLSGALGGILSAKMRSRLSEAHTKRLFIALLVVILLLCAYNVFVYSSVFK